MQLQRLKMMVAAVWMLGAVAVATAADVSGVGAIAVAAIGILPPLAILLLWNDPPQTLSETINQARR
jgi:hypothetical protein